MIIKKFCCSIRIYHFIISALCVVIFHILVYGTNVFVNLKVNTAHKRIFIRAVIY